LSKRRRELFSQKGVCTISESDRIMILFVRYLKFKEGKATTIEGLKEVISWFNQSF